MELSNSKSFISMISQEKPVICFFHNQEKNEEVTKIKNILGNIKKKLPLLPLYEFIRDENEDNEYLCDVMEIATYPILVMYKNGCFNRYKSKNFTEKEILKFIGNKKLYVEQKTEEKIEVEVF